jgi:predicted 3-demethylubiquinone-9 3-methyltransferase (glyoxalase superfamily)
MQQKITPNLCQCGWLKDRYGRKLDIGALRRAADGVPPA